MTTTHTSTEELLASLESMHHAARQRTIAVHCHALFKNRHTTHLEHLLETLRQGNLNHQLLAVTGARASHHTTSLRQSVDAPSMHVQRRALRALCTQPDALPHLLELLEHGTAQIVSALIRYLRRANRRDIINALLETRHDCDIVTSLLSLSDDPELLREEMGTRDPESISWKSLAQRHPETTLTHLESALGVLAPSHARYMLTLYMPALYELVHVAPVRVATLLDAVLPMDHAYTLAIPALRKLAKWAPEHILELLMRPARAPHWRPHIHRITQHVLHQWPEHLQRRVLLEVKSLETSLITLLAKLAPSRRAAHFDAIWPPEERAYQHWSHELMCIMPHALRQREACRMLNSNIVEPHTTEMLSLTSYLGPELAHEQLVAATRGPDAVVRAPAWNMLISTYAMARAPLLPVLALTSRLANEQDPVRLAAARALSRLPGIRFQEQDASALLQLTRFVVEARDSSSSTRHALLTLFQNLLIAYASTPSHPLVQCAFQGILELAKTTKRLSLPSLEAHLGDDAAKQLVEHILPWLKASTERAYNHNVLHVAQRLGKRAWHIQSLHELLAEIIEHDAGCRAEAARLWLASPATREQRALALLDKDPSAFLLDEVAQTLHRRRQDLLTPFLDGRVLNGKFNTLPNKNIYHIPRFLDHFERWTVAQQELFTRTLMTCIQDTQQPLHTRTMLIARLARITTVSLAHMMPLVDSEEVAIQEAALGALPWLDAPQGVLPVLFEHTDGERARVAMYAIPRVARLLPEDTLFEALDTLLARPRNKITVIKEAIRLIGQMGTVRAAERIARIWNETPNLHRDVSLAILHAAHALVEFEPMRQVLETMHTHPDPEVCRAWVQMSLHTIPTSSRGQVLTWQNQLANHPDTRVRRALYMSWSNRPWLLSQHVECQHVLVNALSHDLLHATQPTLWQSAARTLVRVLDTQLVRETFEQLCTTLIAQRLDESEDAVEALPYLYRLDHLVSILCSSTPHTQQDWVFEHTKNLSWPDDCWHLSARLAGALTFKRLDRTDYLSEWMKILEQAPELLSAQHTIDTQLMHVNRWNAPSNDLLLDCARTLLEGTHAAHHLTAFEIAIHVTEHLAWVPAWRDVFDVCRKSPHPTVRHLALRHFMPNR